MEIKVAAPHLSPKYQTDGAAAVDLMAYIDETIYLQPEDRRKVGTGIWLNMPETLAAFVLPRSGLGSRGLTLGNTPGLIDSDYQGEIQLSLWNSGLDCIEIKPGDRIAQLLFFKVTRPFFDFVKEFSKVTKRGDKGFGSTGR